MAEKFIDQESNVLGNCTDEKPSKTNAMFLRIINRDCVTIKSQQRTENELTTEEKSAILRDLYEQKPSSFLARYGKWLSEDDLKCFSGIMGNNDIDYTIENLQKNIVKRDSGISVKNRRYEAMSRLEKDSSYFSEREMRHRCPLLYEQYIGQYMTDEEKLARDEKEMSCDGRDVTMSSFIFAQMDREWLEKQRKLEQEQEDECMEEEEEDDDEEDDDEEDDDEEVVEAEEEGGNKQKHNGLNNSRLSEVQLSTEEKNELRQEFLNIMKEHFLEGQDEDFDYTKVDTSEEYDNLELLRQDEEDKYFDEEEPETFTDEKNSQDDTYMATDSEDDDYLSDKILQKCCAVRK